MRQFAGPFVEIVIAAILEELDVGKQIRLAADDTPDPETPPAHRADVVAARRQRRHLRNLGGRPTSCGVTSGSPASRPSRDQDDAEGLVGVEALGDHPAIPLFEDVEIQHGAREEHRVEWEEPQLSRCRH